MPEPTPTDDPPSPARRRAVLAGILAVGLLLVVTLVVGLTSRGEVSARADGIAPVATPAPPTTPSTTAAPTTTEAPPETAPPTTRSGPPDARPGPPVWPTTGAQDIDDAPVVSIHDAPQGRVIKTLTNPFGPLPSRPAFRVLDRQGPWLHVQLPIRPNGSTGWIHADQVTLIETNISIDIDVAARWMTVYDKDQVVAEGRVVVGTNATPTPIGDFYITDPIANPGGAYGTYALGISGYSDVLTEFAGGEGQAAIHGTNQPWLMGTASSNGCIRVENALATQLGNLATIGVPVRTHNG